MKKLLILMVMFVSPIFSQENKIKVASFSSSNIGILARQVEQFIASNNISKSDIISIQYAQGSESSYSVLLLYSIH